MANGNGSKLRIFAWATVIGLLLSAWGFLWADTRNGVQVNADSLRKQRHRVDSMIIAGIRKEAERDNVNFRRDYQMAIITQALSELLDKPLPVYVDTTDTNGHLAPKDST